MDETEFRNLALAELPAVYRLAYHLAACRDMVDDLVQETYLHAFKAASNFQLTDHGLRPWLFKILHNVVNEAYGKRKRDAKLMDCACQSASAEVHPMTLALPSMASIDWDDVDERLKRAIDQLPPTLKSVFLLSAVEGLRYREIGDVIDAPVGTVMSRLYRARALLSMRLIDLASEAGFVRHAQMAKKIEMNAWA